ncbi:hypothetical protein M0R45_035780 [Rubus argutus]|uniref:MHC class I antigen n=1 Tax=Rubus argutus TaxID=59490 RepID=A0AAW1VVX1_RUBAR
MQIDRWSWALRVEGASAGDEKLGCRWKWRFGTIAEQRWLKHGLEEEQRGDDGELGSATLRTEQYSHHHRLPSQLGIPGLHNCRCGAGNPNWARGGGERVRQWRCGKAREHGLGLWGLWQRRSGVVAG